MNEQNINLNKSINPVERPKEMKSEDCKNQDLNVEIVQVPKSETDDVILVEDVKMEDCDTSERLMTDLMSMGNSIAPAEAYLQCRKRDSLRAESSTSPQAHANTPKSKVLPERAKKKAPRMTWSIQSLAPDPTRKYMRFIKEGINEEDARMLSMKPMRDYYKYKQSLKKLQHTCACAPRVLNLETKTPEVILIDDDEEIASNVNRPEPIIGIKNKEPMSEEQQNMVKRSIIEAITEITDLGTGPSFHNCLFMDGWIYIICENEHSRDWIVNLIENTKLKPWPDAVLSIITEDPLPMPMIGTAVVPSSEAATIEEFKKMLENQNKDLNTSKWKVLQKNVTSHGFALTIRLDAQSAETLQRLDCLPSLGFGKLQFKIKEQYPHLDRKNDHKPISTSEPVLCVPGTSQAYNDETVRDSFADEERNTVSESSVGHEQETQEHSQEACKEVSPQPDQPKKIKEQHPYLDRTNDHKSSSTSEPVLCVPGTSRAHDETVRESFTDEERNTVSEPFVGHEQEPQEHSQEACRDVIPPPDQPPTQCEDLTELSNSSIEWDDPIEPDPQETATDKSTPQKSGDRKRENIRNNPRKQAQNVKKHKPLTEPPEYEDWSESSNFGVDWDDPLQPDPREMARDERFIAPSESGKREKQSENDREKTSHCDKQMPSKSVPTRPSYQDDSRNDRRQRKSSRWETEKDLDKERLQKDPVDRYPRHHYGKDFRDRTLRRDMQTQGSMHEREHIPSVSSSQVIWSVGTIREDTVNPMDIPHRIPERQSNPSHISWTIDPTGNSQSWSTPMQSEQHSLRTLQLNPYNTFRSISTTITNMPEFWIPPASLDNSPCWRPPQHIERDNAGPSIPLRNFPVDSRSGSNNPVQSTGDVIEDFWRKRFPPVWQ